MERGGDEGTVKVETKQRQDGQTGGEEDDKELALSNTFQEFRTAKYILC